MQEAQEDPGMSDLGDDYRAMREYNARHKAKVEEARIQYSRAELEATGARIEPGPDEHSIRVTFPNGRRFNFWPYSGWFAGPTSGRGFGKLLRAAGVR
ncbi:MAG: hypothetical protein LLG97_12355 [Deltaproteobacteria bacterium]|nr:hypothetical protein [Deltaproteobacteria bacterium]